MTSHRIANAGRLNNAASVNFTFDGHKIQRHRGVRVLNRSPTAER